VSIDHKLICGITQKGKSVWAGAMARRWTERGGLLLVYTPNKRDARDIWRPAGAAHITNNAAEAERIFWHHSRRAWWVWDEAGELFGLDRQARQRHAMVTRGRHHPWLHTVVLICQQYRSIAPAVREQCTDLYVFGQGRKSVDALVEERIDRGFERCLTAGVGEFIHKPNNNTPGRFLAYRLPKQQKQQQPAPN
jgi:radical SAM superfamily enzyme YgiQ (UPF0313 family)